MTDTYYKPPPLFIDPFPRSYEYVDKINEQMKEYMRRMAAPAKRGDKVVTTVVGYVRRVNDDGSVDIVATGDPFDEKTIATVNAGKTSVVERAKPIKVGDVISSRQVKATPWKRGTILRFTYPGAGGSGYVLLADGTWRNLDTSSPNPIKFAHFLDSDRPMYRVEYAPGK